MKTKIQIKLNSDVLLTVIQILEETANYPVETTNDALLVSIREDLIEKLEDKSKTIQKQVSILDHTKKHLIVLKYHEAYCLHNLIDTIWSTGTFDSNTNIKKIKRLSTELHNKTTIGKAEEVSNDGTQDDTVSVNDTLITKEESSNTNLFETQKEENTLIESQYDTFAYPLEDNWNIQLTDLVYSLAIDSSDNIISEESIELEEEKTSLDEIISTEESTALETIEAPIDEVISIDGSIEFETVEAPIDEVISTDESITFDATETPVDEVISTDESTALETAEAPVDEVISAEVNIELEFDLVETPLEEVESVSQNNTIFDEFNTVPTTSFENQLLAEQQETTLDEKSESSPTLELNEVEVEETKKKKKSKKEPKASLDHGQMSLF